MSDLTDDTIAEALRALTSSMSINKTFRMIGTLVDIFGRKSEIFAIQNTFYIMAKHSVCSECFEVMKDKRYHDVELNTEHKRCVMGLANLLHTIDEVYKEANIELV